MNIIDFQTKKQNQKKISMITCYDYWTAQIIEASDIDCVLVGDSLAMIMHGHSSTLPANIELMKLHVQAVVKGAPSKFIIGDLPFLSYRKDLKTNMESVESLMQSGAQAVKLEGVDGNEDLIKHIVKSGVPVMGHLGLTPQSLHQLGGFKVQGRQSHALEELKEQTLRLQDAGCFSVVFECIPHIIAQEITKVISIPSIGIGAGPNTDGQVLVLQDMLGMNAKFKPKFLRQFLNGQELILNSLNSYHDAVQAQDFPNITESYE